ncbi:MAG: hypothetical protein ACYC66_13670 [Chloroflexota bacterium]
MAGKIYTLSHLTEEQERLLKESESTLGGGVLLAYREGEVSPAQLNESQMECLKGLEEKLGMTILAVWPS